MYSTPTSEEPIWVARRIRWASPAGQGRGGPVHRQVADADVLEEAQPLGDLAQDQPRDVAVGLGQLDLLEPLQRPPRRQRAEVLDPGAADEHRARLRPQARAAALRARRAAT